VFNAHDRLPDLASINFPQEFQRRQMAEKVPAYVIDRDDRSAAVLR
jgi:hypothetical protein